MSHDKSIPVHLKFVFGGLSGMGALLVVQPLELIKNRMQLSGVGTTKREYRTSFDAFKLVVKNEGILALYAGLSAGLLRQVMYTTTRMGIYSNLLDYFAKADGTCPGFITKAGCSLTAGSIGAFVGTPADVCLVRMTADGRFPSSERRNYKHVGDALVRIVKEEGVPVLFRGTIPTMSRAMIANVAQISTYSQIKQIILERKWLDDNIILHFVSSMISGLAISCASLPMDIAKTRIQNMRTIDGIPEYRGMLDVLTKIIEKEGLFAMWKGFTPYYAKVGRHTVLLLVFNEQLARLYDNLQSDV